MAMTHDDGDHQGEALKKILAEVVADRDRAFDQLRGEAERMTTERENTMTADGEVLRAWELYGVHVTELPARDVDEALNITRVSLGGSPTEGITYCVFRGSVREAKDILRRALNALRDEP